MTLVLSSPHIDNVGAQIRLDRTRWRWTLASFAVLTLVVGAIASATAPETLSLATLLLIVTCVTALAYPPAGVYLLVFFTFMGDGTTASWWPFTKNFSSKESIFYVNDQLTITPLEVVLAVTLAAWIMRAAATHTWRFRRGRLLIPILTFEVFVVMGFLKGAGAGGARNAAIIEVRGLLYLAVVYLLVTNVLTTRRQYHRVFACAMVAVGIQSLFTIVYYRQLAPKLRGAIEDLTEHPASVIMNVLFIYLLCLVLFRGSRWRVWAFSVFLPTIFAAYLLSQRRAAMVALFAGLIILAVVLFFRRRPTFMKIVPAAIVLIVLFVAATWNTQGGIGLPATAVKSALFPDALSTTDAASAEYRDLEAYNLWFTIRASPITGQGFGQPFLVVRPMPDISFFEFWQYLPHNSVLWIWIKTGFFGFVSMLVLVGRTIQLGARSARRVRSADDAALVTAGLAYMVMFMVFAYVDIAFEIRPAVMIGLCAAFCADFERLPEDVSMETKTNSVSPAAVPRALAARV
jgi:hypothetical protein